MTEQIIARLKRKDGSLIAEIPLPRSAAEISLAKYVSFLSEMRKFELENANPVQIMAQAVSEITGVELAGILQAKIGETWAADSQLDGGVRSLYGWCVNAVSNYRGEARSAKNFEFEYKGDKYKIPYIVAAELAGGLPVLPEIETGEAIEAFETMRGFQQQIKDAGDPKRERRKRIEHLKAEIAKRGDADGQMLKEIRRLEAEIDIDGDPNGNLVFAQYLRLVAILAKKDGESLPANDGDRERWIQARMMHLQEIDTKTALDVDFFLSGLLTLSKKTHPVIGSLILPLFDLAAANLSRQQPKERHTTGQLRIKKKSRKESVGGQSFRHLLKGAGSITRK